MDITTITGLCSHRTSVEFFFTQAKDQRDSPESRSTKSYGGFTDYVFSPYTNVMVANEEHIDFLTFLLCRYVFGMPALQITQEFFHVTKKGRDTSFGPNYPMVHLVWIRLSAMPQGPNVVPPVMATMLFSHQSDQPGYLFFFLIKLAFLGFCLRTNLLARSNLRTISIFCTKEISSPILLLHGIINSSLIGFALLQMPLIYP